MHNENNMNFDYKGTTISEPPTFKDNFGQAWRLRLLPIGERGRPDKDATVGVFLVQAPYAHPIWSYWVVSIIHLRDIVGVKKAHLQFPEATHELAIVALNPEEQLPSLDITVNWKIHRLTPTDVIEQFKVSNDAIADQILELSIMRIIDGTISPDEDWRAVWKVCIEMTAEHFNNNLHNINRQ